MKKVVNKSGGIQEVTICIDGVFEECYVKESGTTDPDKHWNTLHVLDGDSRLATVRVGEDEDDDTPEVKYNLEDHLGNSSVMVDEEGDLVNREEYYPYGDTSFGAFAKKRYRYNGKEKDGESGLYNYGMRYYAPWVCRFVSVDPLAAEYPHYTPYQYAGNKPVNFIDMDGLEEYSKLEYSLNGRRFYSRTNVLPFNQRAVQNGTRVDDGVFLNRIDFDSSTLRNFTPALVSQSDPLNQSANPLRPPVTFRASDITPSASTEYRRIISNNTANHLGQINPDTGTTVRGVQPRDRISGAHNTTVRAMSPFELNVNFPVDQAGVQNAQNWVNSSQERSDVVDLIATVMINFPNSSLSVVGHTDAAVSTSYQTSDANNPFFGEIGNRPLSYDRAMAVAQVIFARAQELSGDPNLNNQNQFMNRITVTGVGSQNATQPADANVEQRQVDRKVNVQLNPGF